jgi:hypothetical protein
MGRRVVVRAYNWVSCCCEGLQCGVVLLSGPAMGRRVVVRACNGASCCSEDRNGALCLK